tara:strand:- start:166 stop:903 length:738 start_codon:yes stop_codon:yes gene_type:complete
MPYKSGKMKGELTTPEIRKLIRAHNVLVSIKIPKGSKREDIIALVKKNGYMVDHEKQALIPKVEMKRKPKVDMKKVTQVLPKPKTKLEKQKGKEEKEEKQMQKKKEERAKRKEIVSKALEQQKKNLDKKPKPKPKTATSSTQTEVPKEKKEKKMVAAIRFRSIDEIELVKPNDAAIQKVLKEKYKGFTGIERVKLTATQIKEMNDNQKRPIFDVSTPKDPNIVIVEAKVEGDTKKTLSKVTLKKK